MSTRLQVVMSEEELASLRQAATRADLTLSEWARRALRRERDSSSGPTPASRLRALDQALACDHPTGDIDKMLADIERGRDLR
ncbi:MAG: antitoxin [Acidobacteria bacterium]|nr:antitoxin [Acidobacteriota bacterium]MXZ70051.1 antitoxin [Acidobacteriota bacterium]MYD71332.1 antitoxin [Acidobacteriota bacterium]MYJ04027.1 antitoxin [Acidobacteriota bacterium]